MSEGNTAFNTEMVISRQMNRLFLRLLISGIFALTALAGGGRERHLGRARRRILKGDPQDVAFKFQLSGNTLTGKLFGDEFDLPD